MAVFWPWRLLAGRRERPPSSKLSARQPKRTA